MITRPFMASSTYQKQELFFVEIFNVLIHSVSALIAGPSGHLVLKGLGVIFFSTNLITIFFRRNVIIFLARKGLMTTS